MRFLVVLFLLALAVFLALVLTQPAPSLVTPPTPAQRIGAMSAADIARLGTAARLASEGNTAAQVWLDAQLARVS